MLFLAAAGFAALTAVAAGIPAAIEAGNDPAAILKAGRLALEDGLNETAQKQFEYFLPRVQEGSRESEEGVVLLSRALLGQNKHAEVTALLKARKSCFMKSPDTGAQSYLKALVLLQTGNPGDALKEIAEFDRRYPASPYAGAAGRLEANCNLKLGRIEPALEAFSRFDRDYPDSADSARNILEWSQALVAAGRGAQARTNLGRLVKMQVSPRLLEKGQYWLGQTFLLDSKLDEATNVLVNICANTNAPEDLRAESWYAIARVQELRSNKVEAVASFSNGMILAFTPDIKRRGVYEFGRLLLDQGRLDEAGKILKRFVADAPTDPLSESAQLALASAMLAGGLKQDAVDEFRHYLETFTNVTGQAVAYQNMGTALMDLSRFAEASVAFEKAYGLLGDVPGRAKCLYRMGDAYFADGKYKFAMDAYSRLLKEFPDSPFEPSVMFQLAESMARAGLDEQSGKVFVELAQKFPGTLPSDEALIRMAQLKSRSGNLQAAVEGFSKVVNTSTNAKTLAVALHERGMALHELFRFGDALADFERVVRDYPSNSIVEQSFYMRGMCQYGMGKDDDALAVCNEFRCKYTNSVWLPEVIFWIGTYEFNQGRYEQAEKSFKEIDSRFRNHELADDALLYAGMSLARRKEYLKSIELLDRLPKEYPKSTRIAEARFTQADAMSELQQLPNAIIIFNEVIKNYPSSPLVPSAWSRMAYCQFTLGGSENKKRYEDAIESYRVVENSSMAGQDLVINARYMIGLCLEKLDRIPLARDQYYLKVVKPFDEERQKGIWHSETAKLWFTRAAMGGLVPILEKEKDWRSAVSILEYVARADVPASKVARDRIAKIKAEHRRLLSD